MNAYAVTTALGTFGAPPDTVAWAAVAAACLAVLLPDSARARLGALDPRVAVGLLGATACALSLLYVVLYLGGAPRIIDATSYYLEARSFAEGEPVFPIPPPSGSFRGRFLLPATGESALGVIFPPGYPALLALGFLVRSPMLVGPSLAAALVALTYALARRLTGSRQMALLAAVFSTLSAVLRYHTADTMSHGWSAVLLTSVLLAGTFSGLLPALVAGLALGWLVATRPVTGLAGLLLLGWTYRRRRRELLAAAIALVPGVSLLLLYQYRITGHPFASTQLAYYALADGPPGCFTYGFGSGIGCRVEHGQFVRDNLESGYGLVEAIATTLRRLKMHLADAANAEPLFLLLAWAIVVSRRRAPALVLPAAAIVLVVLLYAPFYFDGNYPGGGARFFADVLPLEHVLLGWAVVRLGVARWAVVVALFGYALHTSYDHRHLAHREGGRPMYEPEVLVRAGIDRGLVLVDTDHGFNLGHDPARPSDGVVVARYRGDAHDRVLWTALGRPAAYRYRYDPTAEAAMPRVEALDLERPEAPLRFEAEAEWPPLEVTGGWVAPDFPACASGARGLSLRPAGRLRARFELPRVPPGRYRVAAGFHTEGSPAPVRAVVEMQGARWLVPAPRRPGCFEQVVGVVRLGGSHSVWVETSDRALTFDYLALRPQGGAGTRRRSAHGISASPSTPRP